MFEKFALPSLSPVQAGLLFLSLGLAVGSFCSVIWHRVPLGQSVLWPRSRCPHCHYTLQPADLVPILSFLWLGGRCRRCRTPAGWHYLMWELGAGLTSLALGVAHGWTGGLASLAAWVAGATLFAFLKRIRLAKAEEAGFTLVEVLVAMALLVMIMAPLLNTLSVARNAAVVGERRTMQVGLARAKMSQLSQSAYSAAAATPLAPTCSGAVGVESGDAVLGLSGLSVYEVRTDVISPGTASCIMQVTVSCPTCRTTSGQALRDYTLQSVIRKKTNGGS